MISEHGGDTYGHDIGYDFSVNLNPLGMPDSVKKALISSVDEWEKYPDPYCRNLVKAIAEREKISVKNVVCGNGAADLIYRIVYALKPKNAVLFAPTFSEYEKVLLQNDCKVITHYLSEQNNFKYDLSVIEKLDDNVDMIFICSPNNPTGVIAEKKFLERIAKKCVEKDIFVVCDECFMDFARDSETHSMMQFLNEKVIVLKAFTKIYAMAGLRLGYAIFGNPELAETVCKTGQFWSVSAPAQIAGLVALSEHDYVEKTIRMISDERKFLMNELSELGFKVYPSDVNFILFHCKKSLDKMLLKEKILIRNCTNYKGLENGYFRIAVRNHDENKILIDAIRRQING